jgi:hypothetical protein
MTALNAIAGTALWYALSLTSLALVTGQLVALIQAVRNRRGRAALLCAALNLLLGFGLLVVLMDCAYSMIVSEADAALFRPFERALFAAPWAVYAVPEAFSAAVLLLQLQDDWRYRRSHLTPDAIRQAVNLLPEGISISDPSGAVLLSNLRMNALCRALTGSVLSDAGRFLRRVREIGEEQDGKTLVRTPSGEAWLITARRITTGGKEYDQLTAADVTERCRIIDELREKSDRLTDIQRRMKAVNALSGDMFVAQEEATARAALHNQLGQVLLMGRRYLERPENTDPHMVRLATKQMNAFLLGEVAEPTGEGESAPESALAMARSIGVTVDMRSPVPRDAQTRALLDLAIRECAANAVKHAEGNRLDVEIADTGGFVRIDVTNNGRPPKDPVAESGGLLSLRRQVEAVGGSMHVQSWPRFALTLEIPALAADGET